MANTDTPTWADRVAERMSPQAPAVEPSAPSTEPEAPAWARVLADRAAGREASVDDVREARERAARPRTEFERRVLARLGHDTNDGPPAA